MERTREVAIAAVVLMVISIMTMVIRIASFVRPTRPPKEEDECQDK